MAAVEVLEKENQHLKTQNEKLNQLNEKLQQQNEALQKLASQLKHEIYGSKTEKYQDLNSGQLVFNEIEQEAQKPEPKPKQTITYTRQQGRGKKKPIPEDLPREESVIDIEEHEKVCPQDGSRLECIGEVITEKLKTVPARSSVVVEKRLKYACPCCDSHMREAKSPSILPGTVATAELLSFVIFSKFFQSLPLYRLEELYRLRGIELSRATMARWLTQSTQKLRPIWNILEDWVFDSGYMAIDATTVQVLKEKGRRAQTKSTMWARGSPEKGIVLFDYDVSGSGAAAKRLITGYKGALQADAHRGYGALDKSNLTLLGCLMHSRRRFYKAWLEAKKQPGVASEALKKFKFIYDKEESYKQQDLSPEQRKQRREEELLPYMEEFKSWCERELAKVPPRSKLGNAFSYFLNEHEELVGFFKDGRFEVDNGWIERVIKRFAVGRKNWMFSDTVEGAHSSSLLYSLTLTAKLNGKDPFNVMTEILKKLPSAETVDDFEALARLLISEENPQSCRKKEGAVIK